MMKTLKTTAHKFRNFLSPRVLGKGLQHRHGSLGLKDRIWIGKRDKDFLGCHADGGKITAESTSVPWENSVGTSKYN